MKTKKMFQAALCAALVAACSSSSTPETTADAGQKHDTGAPKADTGAPKADTGAPEADTGPGKDAPSMGDGGADVVTPAVPHLLVAYNGTTNLSDPSSILAVNLATRKVDGTYLSADSEAIVDTTNAVAPFVLDQVLDTVVRLSPSTWTAAGSWNIPSPPGDAGASDDPYAVSVATGTSLYVISYGSNSVYAYDLASPGQAPTATIDLSPLLEPGDADGYVEATAAVYDPATSLLYVVLGNLNLDDTDDYMGSYDTLCASTTSSVIAIDTTTNKVATLNGTAPGGGITLQGYDPSGPAGVVFDAANNRLLILEAGCNPAPTTDGGAPGTVVKRGVEAVDLVAHTTSILLDASSQGFPGSFVYISPTSAVVSFIYPTNSAFQWDPTTTTLGAAIPTAPDVFDYDGNGNLVGARITYGDAGNATTDIISTSLSTGDVTVLEADAVTLGMYGYIASVGVWPRP